MPAKAIVQSPKKLMIYEKAKKLFYQKGYNATSMRHLAGEVGIEAASLYNHIKGKEDLLREVCFFVAKAFTDHISKMEKSNWNVAAQVEHIIRFHLSMMMDHFEEMYVSYRDWKHLSEPYLSTFLNSRRNYEGRFAKIIEAGIEAKEFKNVHPYTVVLTILSAVRSVEFWKRNNRNIKAADMENDLVKILISGLNK